MKLTKIFAVLLAFSLAGCSLGGPMPDPPDAVLSVPTEEPAESLAPTQNTETEPPETILPTQSGEAEPLPVQPEPRDADFVPVKRYIPDIIVDLRYATVNNFTNQKIYDFTDAWLRYGTVKKLMLVQQDLRKMGLSLKIWDGFRPPSAQFKLWDVCPDPTYVSNPNAGFSSHSRGNTVDVTLVYPDGRELPMPTGFDDFSALADRDYSDCPIEAATNATRLEALMIRYGFKPYAGEWWHFSDTRDYPPETQFQPIAQVLSYANCREYISLRTAPDTAAQVIAKIPAGAQLRILARYGDFSFAEYENLHGYVLSEYIQPVIP